MIKFNGIFYSKEVLMQKMTFLASFIGLAISNIAAANQPITLAQCEALKDAKIYDTTINQTEWLEAGELPQDKNAVMSGASSKAVTAGAHCIVRGEIEKRTGVNGKEYALGFELRLPAEWNKKFLFQGGGGTNGVVSPAIGKAPVRGSSALPALTRGYAVVTTD